MALNMDTNLLAFLRNLQGDITKTTGEPRAPSKRALRLLKTWISAATKKPTRPVKVVELPGGLGDADPVIRFEWTEPRGCSENIGRMLITPEAAAQVVRDLMQIASVRDLIF